MKLDILFHYDVNEQTGEITYIGKEEIHVDTVATKKAASSKSSSAKVDENPEPIITLDSNKLILTQGAVDLLQVCADCRVDIKYKKRIRRQFLLLEPMLLSVLRLETSWLKVIL